MIKFLHVADFAVIVGDPIAIGEARRVIPILGGKVTGPLLQGHILPGGADFQILRKDGVTELEARYVIECEGGAKIYVENKGLRHGPADAMERMRRGEAVDPKLIYFKATPRFETGDEKYRWLTRYIFVCEGVRRSTRVELAVYQVL